MKFYCIADKDTQTTEVLKKSCKEKGIEYIQITSGNYLSFTFSTNEKGILYKEGPTKLLKKVEQYLLSKYSFSTVHNTLISAFAVSINQEGVFQSHKLSQPKTVFNLSKDRDFLKTAVELVGGFPLILKNLGGSHGVGVMKVDSFESLASIVDFFVGKDMGDSTILKEFINVKAHARLIVLGNKVIDSIEYRMTGEDFRSNVGSKPTVRVKKFGPEIEQLAVRAVSVLEKDFGGVDILVDENNKPYLAEVNTPCYFVRSQKISGVDVSGQLISHLASKPPLK
jgi:RimK family alpha-L-glutamate ligase